MLTKTKPKSECQQLHSEMYIHNSLDVNTTYCSLFLVSSSNQFAVVEGNIFYHNTTVIYEPGQEDGDEGESRQTKINNNPLTDQKGQFYVRCTDRECKTPSGRKNSIN